MAEDHNLSEAFKHIADGVSLIVALGALVELLPALAAAMSIIWTGIRIYEWAAAKFWRPKP